jgi:hypothetical protein
MNEFEKDIKRNKYRKSKKSSTSSDDDEQSTQSNTSQNTIEVENLNNNLNDTLTQELNEEFADTITNKPQLNNITQQELQNVKKTRKKEIVYCNADRKTNKKPRVKKEFTKTNRNIMQYNKAITLKFD